jgi:hypothetical protein
MKKLLLLVLLLPTLVFSQQEPVIVDKKVVCDEIKIVIDWIKNSQEQQPLWLGVSDVGETRYGLVENQKTGSWTIIEFNDKYACILGTGMENALILPSY